MQNMKYRLYACPFTVLTKTFIMISNDDPHCGYPLTLENVKSIGVLLFEFMSTSCSNLDMILKDHIKKQFHVI